MADSILRLKVESQEYDSKIKRAAEGIKRYADECKKVGGTLEILDEGVLDFVQALGQMDTVASNSKQQLREMNNALTNLTVTYRGLAEEEKNAPFGRELAKGIQQLTERAGAVQDAMTDVQQSIRNAASDTRLFDQVAQGMSVATAAFQGVTGAAKLFGVEIGDNVEVIAKLQAAMAVTNSLTTIQTALQKQSALMQGVAAVQAKAAAAAIELEGSATKGATVAQAAFNTVAKSNPYVLLATTATALGSAIYVLSQLNKEATASEKEQIATAKKQQAEYQKMQSTIGSAVGDIEAKYRSLQQQWKMLNTLSEKNDFIKEHANAFKQLGLNVSSVTSAEQILVNMAPQVVAALRSVAEAEAYSDLYKQAVQNKVKNWTFRSKSRVTGDYYTKVSDAEKTQRGVLAPEEWTAAGLVKGQDYTQKLKGVASYEFRLSQSGIDKINQYRQQEANKLNKKLEQGYEDDIKKYEELWAAAEQRAAKNKSQIPLAYLSGDATATPSANAPSITPKAEKEIKEKTIDTRTLGGFNAATISAWTSAKQSLLSETDFSSPDYNAITENLKDMSTLTQLIQEAVLRGFDVSELGLDSIFTDILGGIDISDDAIINIVEQINKSVKEGLNPLEFEISTGNIKELKAASQGLDVAWLKAASAASQLGGALAGIEDPAVKVAGIVAQAIATIAQTFAESLKGTFGPWDWIAAAIAGTATMISTISAIKSATRYADGGIVKGNSYSGDNIAADNFVNAGELILNKAQQSNLASILEGNNGGGSSSQPYVTGEKIVLGINNWGKRMGKGELVFSRE